MLLIRIYDIQTDEAYEVYTLPRVPCVGEMILMMSQKLKVVTRVVFDLPDNLVRVYVERAPL